MFLTHFFVCFVFYCDISFSLTSEIHLHSDCIPPSSSASRNVCKEIWKGPLFFAVHNLVHFQGREEQIQAIEISSFGKALTAASFTTLKTYPGLQAFAHEGQTTK